MQPMPIYVTGLGHYHPEERVTNAHLEELVDTSDAWIVERTGIHERRRAARDQLTSDLGLVATRRALASAGWSAEELDLVIVATSSPDTLIPPTACHMAAKLGIDVVAFDVNGACAGFAYGLATVRGLMRDVGYHRVALCCAERYTGLTDYTDRASCVLFGDSAATLLLCDERPARGAEVADIELRNEHAWKDLVTVPVGGYFRFAGRQLKEPAGGLLARNAEDMLKKHGLRADDIRAFMGHQANYRLLESVGARLGIVDERHWSNVRTMGNQGAAGALTTFCAGVEQHADELADGDLLLLSVVGSGLTSGCVLLRWISSDGETA
jgi:3-oxoacyl-[acyl-carrier-protein] synthase-3